MVGPNFIKRINQARILNLLRVKGTISRAEISRRLKLTRSTVSLLTADLLGRGIIIDASTFESSQPTGRPSVGMQLNPKGGYCIGVEIGVESIRVIVIDLMVKILSDTQKPLDSRDPARAVEQAVGMIQKARAETIQKSSRLFGIGLTVPGMLNRRRIVEYALALGWRDLDLKALLEERLDVPVFIENDANAAALAEFYFSGLDVEDNLFYLLLDVGVGGGIIVDKTIYRGSFGTAGEIGHMRVPVMMNQEGALQTLSFEDCVGKRALLTSYRKSGGTSEDFSTFCENLERGEAAALKTISQWASLLALGIVNIIDVLDPSHIILGGPLARFFPYVQTPLSLLQQGDSFPGASAVQLSQSRFKDDACAMGAAALVYESIFRVVQDRDAEGSGYWIAKPLHPRSTQ